MYGGAVFDLDGRHFDIHFRNLDVVEHWTREANEGRFEVHILGFHLAGIPTYMLTGELAGSRDLWGELPHRNIRRRSAGVRLPHGWIGRNENSITRGIGPLRGIRSVAPVRWPRSCCRGLMLGWRTEQSGH